MTSVLTVNAVGYLAAPWGPMLGVLTADDPVSTAVVQGVVGTLLQGKGYPMMAFLFGMGLWLALRGKPFVDARALGVARQQRLLRLGVAHGSLVYFGDILTLYALVGRGLFGPCRERWPLLRRRIRRAVVWAVLATLLPLLLTPLFGLGAPGQGGSEARLAEATGWLHFWRINAGAYATVLAFSLVLAWPVVRLCMLCGIAAARLRLLSHRRWRAALGRWTRRLAAPLLVLNAGAAWTAVGLPPEAPLASWAALLGGLVHLPLAAVYLMALALAGRGGHAAWCRWLAPLGARTLTLYVGHGVLCAVLFSGAGLGWRPSAVAMLAWCAALWCVALVAARASADRRWPLERWLARR